MEVKRHRELSGIWRQRLILDSLPCTDLAVPHLQMERRPQSDRQFRILVQLLRRIIIDRPVDPVVATRVKALKVLMAADGEPGIVPLIGPSRPAQADRREGSIPALGT